MDNARIEVEEGPELPVLDGSADGWVSGKSLLLPSTSVSSIVYGPASVLWHNIAHQAVSIS